MAPAKSRYDTAQPVDIPMPTVRQRSEEEEAILRQIRDNEAFLESLHKRLHLEERITELKQAADNLRYTNVL